MTKKKSICVISDRYLPYAVGGGEISLHGMLKGLSKEYDIQVYAICGERIFKHSYEYDGIKVTQVPEQAAWPLHYLKKSCIFNKLWNLPALKKIKNLIYKRAINKIYWLSKEEKEQFYAHCADKPAVQGRLMIDEQYYAQGYTRRELAKLLKNKHYDAVHLDNFRAICTSDLINADTFTALIRDNRFYCSRFNGSMMLKTKPCTDCNHECTVEDMKPQTNQKKKSFLSTFKRILKNNTHFRINSLNNYSNIITTSKFLHHNTSQITDSNINIIPNSVGDIAEIDNYILGTPERVNFNIIIIGMLTETKGQPQLIKAWKKHLQSNPDIHLHFAGRGDRIEKRLRELASEYNIEDQMHFHGFLNRKQIMQLMASCQLVLSPTIGQEAFGRVPLEAGIIRKPIISFAIAGLKENIINDKTGYLVDYQDYNQLFEKTIFLKNNPKKCLELGLNARKFIIKNYSPTSIAEKFVNLLKSL